MTTKNYGPSVSGYLDPSGRNWENPVFQAGKPVLDKELNLVEDLSSGYGQAALRRAIPSGWISDDFTSSSDMASAIFTPSTTPDELVLPNGLVAHVTGWLLDLSYTNSSTQNQILLSSAPLAVGSRRTDLVILEVWRRLLSAAPSTDGKSPLGRIWRNGNVKIDPVDDAMLNYDDDILDTAVGSESTKRVQLQYRLRVINYIDVFAYPYGINDPTVVANSVPSAAMFPDGVATTFVYANQSGNGDSGLWVAGDGNPTNDLNTVDGYMYAIPLMAVTRRNQSPFDRNTNHNGAVDYATGTSDRPDGLFYDIIDARDILDLRNGVQPTGWNYAEVLTKNFNYLLDNQIRTDWMTTAVGGGYSGHTVFTADEIGVLPGDGVDTGDTPGANFIGEFDSVRRFFSDRSMVEVVTVALPCPAADWTDAVALGAPATLNPTALPVYPFAAYNWASRNPASVLFLDVVGARWVGEAADATRRTIDATPYIQTVKNLGVAPLVAVDILFGSVPADVIDQRLMVDLLISWPSGLGLTKTPTANYPDSIYVNNPAMLPAGAALVNTNFDFPHREVQMQFTQDPRTIVQMAEEPAAATYFILPERAASIVSVLKNGAAIAGSTSIGADGYYVTFDMETTSPMDDLTIEYVPLRPLPENSVQITTYYEARAPQTSREALIGTTLSVIPRCIGSSMYTLTVGSGSPDTAYPFETAYTQMGGIFPTAASTFAGDHELAAAASIFTSEFNASTGFLKLPMYIDYVANPQEVVFNRMAGNIDAEDRTYFPEVPAGVYIPNAYSQPLTDAKRHRNILPVLAELTADTALGFKGQLLLVLLLREALFDKTNGIFFDPDPNANTTVASVFRVKGNLLNKRA